MEIDTELARKMLYYFLVTSAFILTIIGVSINFWQPPAIGGIILVFTFVLAVMNGDITD